MANEYGFFAAKNHDRRYSADDLCALFRDFFTDGVYGKDTNGFLVSAQGDMNISVGGGTAYIQGRWYRKSSSQTVKIGNCDSLYGRYDGVVIRCDHEKREVYVSVTEGIPSEVPEKPAPQRDECAYEIVLAYIYVGANSVEVTQSDIEDVRGNSELCGWVTSAIDHIDTTGLFAQYEAQWELLKAACRQDADAVISAWNSLNAVKKVNGEAPVDGNVQINLDGILSGSKYPKYTVQWGVITDTSKQPNIVFEKPFKGTPVIFLTGYDAVGSSYYATVFNASATGFTAKYNVVSTVSWIAFGDIVGEGEREV